MRLVELLPAPPINADRADDRVRRRRPQRRRPVTPLTSTVKVPACTDAPVPMNARLDPSTNAVTLRPPTASPPPAPPVVSAVAVWLTRAADRHRTRDDDTTRAGRRAGTNRRADAGLDITRRQRRTLGSRPTDQTDRHRHHVNRHVGRRRRRHRQRRRHHTRVRPDSRSRVTGMGGPSDRHHHRRERTPTSPSLRLRQRRRRRRHGHRTSRRDHRVITDRRQHITRIRRHRTPTRPVTIPIPTTRISRERRLRLTGDAATRRRHVDRRRRHRRPRIDHGARRHRTSPPQRSSP